MKLDCVCVVFVNERNVNPLVICANSHQTLHVLPGGESSQKA